MDTLDQRPEATDLDVPVLVVGAGPAGLVTAIGLARHGVRPLVVERHPSTSIFPRATGVSTRSMEVFRGWGIDDEVRRGGWDVIPQQATVRRLDDSEVREEPLGFPDADMTRQVSPTTAAVSPQDHLEPVLVAHLRALGGEVRFSTEVVAFEQVDDRVIATLRDRTSGQTSTVTAGYLVGADGHRSTIRTSLGIPMEGPDELGRFMSILFRADLSDVLGERRYGLYVLEGPGGPPTVVVPSGADDRFVLGIPLPPDMTDEAVAATFTPDRCVELVRAAAGRPAMPVEILATSSFAFAAQIAARVRDGRAFLVGDAAHRMTPRGGRGMNTAIADGFDLGWKLAWVIRRMAGPDLLDTYVQERAPVGRRNVALSMAPAGGGTGDGLLEDLGVVVSSSAIVAEPAVPGSNEPGAGADGAPTLGATYVPDARPGARAPHVWLTVGDRRISTLDLFGNGFVLVTNGDAGAWLAAARQLHPNGLARVTVQAIGSGASDLDGAFAATYRLETGGAVLVRPDGIVAWRTRSLPHDPGRALAAAVATATCREVSPPSDHEPVDPALVGPTVVARPRLATIGAFLGPIAWAWGFTPPVIARSTPPSVARPAAGPRQIQPAGSATTKRLLA